MTLGTQSGRLASIKVFRRDQKGDILLVDDGYLPSRKRPGQSRLHREKTVRKEVVPLEADYRMVTHQK